MKQFTVSTHHAYLNTDIVLKSDVPHLIVADVESGNKWAIEGEKHIYLNAGEHHLISESTEETIIIEDAIKLGGGNLSYAKAFVFDNNPWIFVTLKDRLYITNREGKQERVEYNIHVDEVICLEDCCESFCFLFKTESDYSIYDVYLGKIIHTFSQFLYGNGRYVVYQAIGVDEIRVYDYLAQEFVLQVTGQYTIVADCLYFIKDNSVYHFNLKTGGEKKCDDLGYIRDSDYVLSGDCFVKKDALVGVRKRYALFYLNDSEQSPRVIIDLPFTIASLFGKDNRAIGVMREKYDELCKAARKEMSSIECPIIVGIKIIKVTHSINAGKYEPTICGEMYTYPNNFHRNYSFVANVGENGIIDFDNVSFTKWDDKEPDNDIKQQKYEPNLYSGERLLGLSKGNQYYVTFEKHKLYLNNGTKEERVSILETVLDDSRYKNAYFTSDGKNVVLQTDEALTNILGFEDLQLTKFDIEGGSVARNAGFNGYKPEIDINLLTSRKPVWRDPISLRRIEPEELSNYVFKSPDGKYEAKNDMLVVYYDKLTQKEITEDEYYVLHQKYNNVITGQEEVVKKNRIALVEQYGKERFYNLIKGTPAKNERQLDDEINELLDVHKCLLLTTLFTEKYYYVAYNRTNSSEQKRVLIGQKVWFLNYVSFSYDSKYLAFGARLRNSENYQGGVFKIYDIEKEEIVFVDTHNGLNAVWVTMFNKNGDVAYYESNPNAYIINADSQYKEQRKIENKSLLCFSPSAKYIALSNQKYIDYTHHPNEDWGHQPSGNVFVYNVDDTEHCLEQYNDLGEGIEGISNEHGNVASAAFSQDDKRLLMVGTDGVVVIRNLHYTK